MADQVGTRCPVCGGTKHPGKTIFTVELGFGVVALRDVPATVCALCGEDWISDAVAEKLEVIVQEARCKPMNRHPNNSIHKKRFQVNNLRTRRRIFASPPG